MLNKELLLGSNQLLRRCVNYRIEGSVINYFTGERSNNNSLLSQYITTTTNTANKSNVDITFDITGLIDEVKITDNGYILLIIGGVKGKWYISDTSGSDWNLFFDHSNSDDCNYFPNIGADYYHGKFLHYTYELGDADYLSTGKFRIKNVGTEGETNPGIVLGGYIRRPSEFDSLGNFYIYMNNWYGSNFPTLRTDAGLEIYTD